MKPLSFLLTISFLFLCCLHVNGRTLSYVNDTTKRKPENFLKINLTALVLKNYSLQYERILNRKTSLAIAFRTMPNSSLPLKNLFVKDNNNQDAKDAIESLRLGNIAITPELRFYMSKKGYGRGFYIAPFYRYASFKINQLEFNYTNNSNTQSSMFISGKITANTGGILFGAQWPMGKHCGLDLWIVGPHYGSGNGNFSGTSSTPLTQSEQDDLSKSLNDFKIPTINKTVTVTANQATMKLDGGWAGIRSGLSFGVRF